MFEKTLNLTKFPFDPKKVAISCDLGDGHWVDMTFKELEEIVNEVKNTLFHYGIRSGDRILVVGENHFKWLPMFLGIAGYGGVAVPVDGTLAEKRLLAIVADCSPRLIMVSKKFQDKIKAVLTGNGNSCTLVNFHFDVLVESEEIKALSQRPKAPAPQDLAAIIYTSGTSGKPKGIMLSHGALASAVQIGIGLGKVGPSDVMLTILPFTHVFGLVDAGLSPLAVGSRLVMTPSMNPADILQAVMKYRVSFILVVPRLAEVFAMIFRQVNVNLPGVKMVIGGAACSPEVIKALRSHGIRAFQGFGMTETAGGIVACPDGPFESVGRPPEGVEFKIDGPKGKVGEILVASPTLLSGVFGNPDQAREMFSGKYLRTGDLGEIDSEGYIYIKGRAKDVIIPGGGVNVYPDELELRIGVLPCAEEYCILGMKEEGHEFPVMAIKIRKDFFPGLPDIGISDFVNREVEKASRDWPDWEKIRRVIIVDKPLPRSASQKVQRNRLVEMLKAPDKPVPSQTALHRAVTLNDPHFGKFAEVVAHFLNCPAPRITPETRLNEFLQLDSLGIIALASHLELVFSIDLRDVSPERILTFGGLFSEVIDRGGLKAFNDPSGIEEDKIGMPPLLDFSHDAVKTRQKLLQARIHDSIKILPRPDDAKFLSGNIEGFFGFSQIPLGLAGPLKVIGEHANGEYYLPLATTEGALVSSVARGAQLITMAGGARAKVLADSLVRAPLFLFESLTDAVAFSGWVTENFFKLKEVADSTSRFGRLEAIEHFPMGTNLCLRFVYTTGDASGQNMTTIATHKALELIRREYKGKILDFFLEANFSGDKKVNSVNFTRNRGKRVIAEAEIPGNLVEKMLHTTVERICKLGRLSMVSSLHAHSFGSQAHFANILAAIFIAAGQDPACVAESAAGITTLDDRNGNLAVTVTLPDLMIGTVGGGTRLPTQQVCLQILECDGPRKAKKMAEIIAVAVLAGEISLIGAMAADEFASAHARYGRSASQKA